MKGIWIVYLLAGFIPFLILEKLPDHLIKWVNINVANELKVMGLCAMLIWLIAFLILGVREVCMEDRADKQAAYEIDNICDYD